MFKILWVPHVSLHDQGGSIYFIHAKLTLLKSRSRLLHVATVKSRPQVQVTKHLENPS